MSNLIKLLIILDCFKVSTIPIINHLKSMFPWMNLKSVKIVDSTIILPKNLKPAKMFSMFITFTQNLCLIAQE